jgi:hypothetical protein
MYVSFQRIVRRFIFESLRFIKSYKCCVKIFVMNFGKGCVDIWVKSWVET